jgi:excisionase family DNA binding protein
VVVQHTLTDFSQLPETMTLNEAAELLNISVSTLRKAYRAGELTVFAPRGRHPLHMGPGMGYRVARAELQRWYFAPFREASPNSPKGG